MSDTVDFESIYASQLVCQARWGRELPQLLTAHMFDANGDDPFGFSAAACNGTLSKNIARKKSFAEDFIFAISTI